MKILLLTVSYSDTIQTVYGQRSDLSSKSYAEQKEIVDKYISIWTSGWEGILTKKGYDVFSIPINVVSMQKKWAEENALVTADIHEIAFQQIKKFSPDILWYDYFNIPLLLKIKEYIKSLKLILGWTGSAVVNSEVLKHVDLVLSCAPETVKSLKQSGLRAMHLNHAFNPDFLNIIKTNSVKSGFSFVGQIFRGGVYHERREVLLKKLVRNTGLEIYSPSYNYGVSNILKNTAKKLGYYTLLPFNGLKLVKRLNEENEYFKELTKYKDMKIMPYDLNLKSKLKPPVYGLEMLRTLANSQLVLNIHANSSPEYASNMRLFETTGVGTCLLTDWKKNINDLFKEDIEIMTYKSEEECVEKANWLISNPGKCNEIGIEGQKRTLVEHTYEARSLELIDIITKDLKK